jgi:hypothetical protein
MPARESTSVMSRSKPTLSRDVGAGPVRVPALVVTSDDARWGTTEG